jgi:hypothetical protein
MLSAKEVKEMNGSFALVNGHQVICDGHVCRLCLREDPQLFVDTVCQFADTARYWESH